MSDLISRQAAIDAVSKGCQELRGVFARCEKNLLALPSAQQWIPVSERLPEVGRNVLLSVGKGLYTAEGELKHDGTWVQYRWSANIENVDAWAEMPDPWRGEFEILLTDNFWCDECKGHGDDYYFDEDGELVSACETCPIWITYGEEDE